MYNQNEHFVTVNFSDRKSEALKPSIYAALLMLTEQRSLLEAAFLNFVVASADRASLLQRYKLFTHRWY